MLKWKSLKKRETGRLWAVQCKCFDESYQVNKTDIDSFFTLSGKNPFKVRLIVTTTANWSPNALDALKNQTKECKTLDLHDLEQADIERYQYKQDKKTDLVNDPNTYSNDPAYILKLLLSVITVSLKTQELVQSLPSIDFDSLIASMDKTG